MIIKDYILARLKEASTWRSIVYILTASGMHIEPAMGEQIVQLGLLVAGAIGVLTADRKSETPA